MKVAQFFNLIGIKLHMDFGKDIQILTGKAPNILVKHIIVFI